MIDNRYNKLEQETEAQWNYKTRLVFFFYFWAELDFFFSTKNAPDKKVDGWRMDGRKNVEPVENNGMMNWDHYFKFDLSYLKIRCVKFNTMPYTAFDVLA